jgi:hypothetical protein
LIQDCHETRTRLPYGEAPTADYGGAMEMCRDSRGSVRTRTETRTRLAVWRGAPADYGGAMRDNLSGRPPICNKRLYHDRSTNRDCHGSNGAVSSASDLLHHRSQVMRRTETATDPYRTVSSDSEHGATWAATYLGPLRTIAEIGPGPITL